MSELSRRLRKGIKPKPPWKKRPEILLCHRIPEPLHGVAPRVVLGGKWWDKTRKEAYKSTNYHCIACGVHKLSAKYRKWLEAHEVYYIDYLVGRMEYVETVPLCHFCHNFIHMGRLQALLERGQINHGKFTAIVQHGNSVLKKANLRKEPFDPGPMADWKDWRLILFGKEYPPLYETPEEARKAHEA